TRREIKNLNSFKFMQQAIDFEVRWQIEQIEDGHAIEQATVLFDPDTGETRAMRTKEDAADYRYFPDPDLPPLVIARDWVDEVRAGMTELPRAMAERFVRELGLPEYDALMVTQSPGFARYFTTAQQACGQPKLVANWMMGELSATLNREGLEVEQACVGPLELAALVQRVDDGTVSNKAAREVFAALWADASAASGAPADLSADLSSALARVDAVIAAKGLKQMNDSGALDAIIDTVLAANEKNVAEYRAGKDKAFNALVGQVMKASQGKANPAQVNAALKARLDG
nr:Asp-tRNA(Asn)/Glu-tRNA(Gln) amidotransferase GatCAB subunit B [Serpentinimonas sp.]